MLKLWVFPLLSALALALTLGGSALPSVSDPFPIESAYTDCPAAIAISSTGEPVELGVSAIQPHLRGIPAFTADDARRYIQANGAFGADGPFTILKVLFITSREVCERTRGESTGLEPGALVCFVELQGTFYPISYPYGARPIPSSYSYEVYDAQTGNLLMFSS